VVFRVKLLSRVRVIESKGSVSRLANAVWSYPVESTGKGLVVETIRSASPTKVSSYMVRLCM
jgi:hypothetical protein